jgi:hypothetical protein
MLSTRMLSTRMLVIIAVVFQKAIGVLLIFDPGILAICS